MNKKPFDSSQIYALDCPTQCQVCTTVLELMWQNICVVTPKYCPFCGYPMKYESNERGL